MGGALPEELVHGRVEPGEQVAPPMEPAPGDERERLPRLAQRRGIGTGQKRGEVHPVLWTCAVVSSEYLQGNEVAEPHNRHREAWYCLDPVGRSHDLGLDAGRGEEQVDDRPADVLAGERQPDGRQASRDGLLDRCDDLPPARLEVADERLGVPIVGDEHREIGVTREPGLAPG